MPRFGAYVPSGRKLDLTSYADGMSKYGALRRVAVQAENLGFDSIWFYDHFIAMPPGPQSPETQPVTEATFECWSLLAALSAVTTRIRLGSMVTSMSYRPPPLLAKMASVIDVISAGRLNVGIGAGWQESEYRAYGYEYPPLRVRLEQLEEAILVMKAMWTETYPVFAGDHFRIDGAINEPKPVQTPHPPLWVGGSGRRTLRIGAAHGNAVNFSGSPVDIAGACATLASHCADLGRDYGSITKSVNFEPVIIRPTTSEAVAYAATIKPEYYATVDDWRTRTLIGSPEYCRERIQEYRAEGIDYFVSYFADAADDPAGMNLFAEEVLPAFA